MDLRNPSELPDTTTEKTELFPEPRKPLPLYEILPPDYSEAPRGVPDPIRDSELPSDSPLRISQYYPSVIERKCDPMGSRTCRHDRDTSLINNQ